MNFIYQHIVWHNVLPIAQPGTLETERLSNSIISILNTIIILLKLDYMEFDLSSFDIWRACFLNSFVQTASQISEWRKWRNPFIDPLQYFALHLQTNLPVFITRLLVRKQKRDCVTRYFLLNRFLHLLSPVLCSPACKPAGTGEIVYHLWAKENN